LQPTTNETTESETSRVRRVAVIAALAVVAIIVLVLVAQVFAGFVAGEDDWAVQSGQPIEVTIAAGSSASGIYVLLHEQGVARSSEVEAAARASGVEDRLQAGTYSFTTDMDPSLVVRRLVEGGDVTTGATFTVIEGWTVDRIIDELSEATPYTRAEFQKALRDGLVSSPLLPIDVADPLVRWEGLLYPAKYPIAHDATPRQILQPMADEMIRRFDAIDWSSIGELEISRYEALVIGSLIEWEAGVDEDRGMISSVVHNRLDQDMRLQIDATVIYALGYNPKRVLAEHLKTVSPYNTYLVDGLPPTPIGTVSTASLEAALHPAHSDYLFYVLGNEDGSHVFAVTYEQHQANVKAAKDAGILP
jgi:UPF0755 protein